MTSAIGSITKTSAGSSPTQIQARRTDGEQENLRKVRQENQERPVEERKERESRYNEAKSVRSVDMEA